jgi:hypothetical protein
MLGQVLLQILARKEIHSLRSNLIISLALYTHNAVTFGMIGP